ncbi:MAG: glycosyltransferase family 4 protein [Acidimicrobiales bacterium]
MADRSDPLVLLIAEQLRRAVPGGIGVYVEGLLAGLAAMGGEAPDATLWASRAPGARRPDPLASLGSLVTSRLPGAVLVKAWDLGLGRPRFDDGENAVVHASSLATPPAARRRGGPALSVMIHDLAWRRFPDAYPARGRRWHEAALRRAIARAGLLLAPSSTTAADLLAAGALSSRLEVVEHGCDHLARPDPEAAGTLLGRVGVEGPYILTVSTIEPRKNLPALLAAYAAARPRLPEPWPLLVVGPSGWGPRLTPPPGVVLAGPVSGGTLSALYGGARVVAYVPVMEGFGLPPIEAMSCGTPVVATPMPSTGGAAFEVRPDDVGGIADALVQVCTDDSTRADLVAAGYERAAVLTWERSARRHVELWNDLIESRRR